MHVRIRKGLDLEIGTRPCSSIVDTKPSSTSTLLGGDYPGVRFQLLVEEGSQVRAGQAILHDRRRPEILFASPVSGTVSSINRGLRRSLNALQITADDNIDGIDFEIPASLDLSGIRKLMLQAGLWPALRCRPFGTIPGPADNPQALLVTAIDTQPLAPDPAEIISRYSGDFSSGLKLLCGMVDSAVFLCKSSRHKFEHDDSIRAEIVDFDGPHPAGLVGAHIHSLCPIGFDGNQVWHIGYQDVISLGRLLASGRPWWKRVVSLAGPAVTHPRYLEVPLGARIEDITSDELTEGAIRAFSGSILSGSDATHPGTPLGRYHNQVTALFESTQVPQKGWMHKIFDTKSDGKPDPLIPGTDLQRVSPPGVLAVPFMRALLVGDVERARDLGALELVEEDLALLSFCCPSKTDYGPLLRDILKQIHREGLSIRS
jgi:Na+-transporting NADH:ubiquinone oxidoreductase subunit A